MKGLTIHASDRQTEGDCFDGAESKPTHRLPVAFERAPASIEVHDTVAGIEPAARDRIVEIFVTAEPAGGGLGLAISRAIGRAHGGDVVLLSTTDRGRHSRLTLRSTAEDA